MKTIIFLALTITLALACDNQATTPTDSPPVMDSDKISVKDTISLQKFNKWKKQWEKDGESFMDTAALFEYFTLPVVDLTELLAENVAGTKFYFGLEKLAKEKYTLKFMLVGTDKKRNDLIDYENGNYIYDKSKTCPPFCDPD